MTPIKVKAAFDIGKTNKKFFLFDEEFNVVYSEITSFAEVLDDDGDYIEDLNAVVVWAKLQVEKISLDERFQLESLNFSTYELV